jgi:hypothetical protein
LRYILAESWWSAARSTKNGAIEMLREHSRIAYRKLIDPAAAVVDGHRLFPKHAPALPEHLP